MNRYMLTACLALLLSGAQAQLHFRSLNEILAYADSNAASIRTSVLQQQLSESKARESKSYLYPSLSGSASYNNNLTLQPTLVPEQLFNPAAPEGSFREMTFGKQHLYTTGVQAQWNLLDFQRIFAGQAAAMQSAADKINVEKVKLDTYNQLASTWYSIQLARYSLQMYKKDLAVTKEILAGAEEKYGKGVISEEERNRAAIEQLQNERNVTGTEQDIEQLFRQLQMQLGTEEKISVEEESGAVPLPLITEDPSAWPAHPDVSRQQAEVAFAKSSLKESRALHYPSLSVVYQYNYNWASNSFMDFSEANHLPQQFAGLKLSIPLFNGFATKQKVTQSALILRQQEIQLENLRVSTAKEDEILVLQYRQADDKLSRNREILELQERNDFHTANQYRSGLISLDARMDKYRDLVAVQNAWLQSLAEKTLSGYKIFIRQFNY